MSYNLIIHILTSAIAFLGLVVEPKKDHELPYSFRNLSRSGIFLILLIISICIVGIISNNEKKQESRQLKEGLKTIALQYNLARSQSKQTQSLSNTVNMLKEALEFERQKSRPSTTSLEILKNVTKPDKPIEQNDIIIKLIENLNNYDFAAANELILMGQKAVPYLRKAKNDGVGLASYVLHKIKSGYGKSIQDGTALTKEIKKLNSPDRDIRSEGAGNIRVLIPSLSNDEKDRVARALASLVADKKEDDDKSSARLHAIEGLVELRHFSIPYISQYLINKNERVEVNMSFAAFGLSELISTKDKNFLYKLKAAKNGAGSFWAKKALENFEKES